MRRISERFRGLKDQGRVALVPFVTAGDPHPVHTVPLMHAMVASGADVIELGVPFSDPMADGPVIQRASERALRHHVGLRRVLELVQDFRTTDGHTPLVLMGYLNPIESMGYEEFASRAQLVGVDGVLTVDLPPEEAGELSAALIGHGIDPIFLIAPTTTPERIARICGAARGFVYYVSLKGVTGAAHLDVDAVAERLREVRVRTSLPVGVGFGIRDAETAAQVARIADAVVVGSTLVRQIGELAEEPDRMIRETSRLLSDLRRAMDAAAVAAQ